MAKIRAQYEMHGRWLKSWDQAVLVADKEMFKELSKNGGTYLEYLRKQREKYLAIGEQRGYNGPQELLILSMLNDEIAKLTQFEIKPDTTELEDFDDILDSIYEDTMKLMDADISWDNILPDPHGLFDSLDEYYEKVIERTKELNEDLEHAMVDGFANAIERLGDAFAGVEDINAGMVLQALLDPIADMAIQSGKIVMLNGLAVEAFRDSLMSLNGAAAIAAGAALIAAGAAAKAGLKALANSGSSATTTTSGYAGAAGQSTQTMQTELTIYIKGRLSGSDIVLSGQRTLNEWSK